MNRTQSFVEHLKEKEFETLDKILNKPKEVEEGEEGE